MPWCQNPMCGKQNLKKEDVEFDERRQAILCTPCYTQANPEAGPAAKVLEMMPKSGPLVNGHEVFYELALNSTEGIRAEIRYRDLSLQFKAAPDEIHSFIKRANNARSRLR